MLRNRETLPSPELLASILSYCPNTGVLRWLAHNHVKNTRPVGQEAGYLNGGYRFVQIGGRKIPAHCIAWAIHYGEWPIGDIDHANRVKDDNRIDNLRDCSQSQNAVNKETTGFNLTGFRGVSEGHKGKFVAYIGRNGKRKYLGTFETAEDASAAYVKAHVATFGEFSYFAATESPSTRLNAAPPKENG